MAQSQKSLTTLRLDRYTRAIECCISDINREEAGAPTLVCIDSDIVCAAISSWRLKLREQTSEHIPHEHGLFIPLAVALRFSVVPKWALLPGHDAEVGAFIDRLSDRPIGGSTAPPRSGTLQAMAEQHTRSLLGFNMFESPDSVSQLAQNMHIFSMLDWLALDDTFSSFSAIVHRVLQQLDDTASDIDVAYHINTPDYSRILNLLSIRRPLRTMSNENDALALSVLSAMWKSVASKTSVEDITEHPVFVTSTSPVCAVAERILQDYSMSSSDHLFVGVDDPAGPLRSLEYFAIRSCYAPFAWHRHHRDDQSPDGVSRENIRHLSNDIARGVSELKSPWGTGKVPDSALRHRPLISALSEGDDRCFRTLLQHSPSLISTITGTVVRDWLPPSQSSDAHPIRSKTTLGSTHSKAESLASIVKWQRSTRRSAKFFRLLATLTPEITKTFASMSALRHDQVTSAVYRGQFYLDSGAVLWTPYEVFSADTQDASKSTLSLRHNAVFEYFLDAMTTSESTGKSQSAVGIADWVLKAYQHPLSCLMATFVLHALGLHRYAWVSVSAGVSSQDGRKSELDTYAGAIQAVAQSIREHVESADGDLPLGVDFPDVEASTPSTTHFTQFMISVAKWRTATSSIRNTADILDSVSKLQLIRDKIASANEASELQQAFVKTLVFLAEWTAGIYDELDDASFNKVANEMDKESRIIESSPDFAGSGCLQLVKLLCTEWSPRWMIKASSSDNKVVRYNILADKINAEWRRILSSAIIDRSRGIIYPGMLEPVCRRVSTSYYNFFERNISSIQNDSFT